MTEQVTFYVPKKLRDEIVNALLPLGYTPPRNNESWHRTQKVKARKQRNLARLRANELAAAEMCAALEKCVSVFREMAEAGDYPRPLMNNGGWKFVTDAISAFRSPVVTEPQSPQVSDSGLSHV